ncbi:MAG: universal stress protein [Solirubrobacterales bacterium]|nr:universal stress protein [Solirubrobacterales bacterium]MBV9915690.1 universal stress protein [Solirubrobacterales bacterium]
MFWNVLVGVDGRQGGRDAIALARQLAAPQSTLTLGHVYGADWFMGRGAGLAVAYEREATEQLLRSERTLAEVDAELDWAAFAPPARGLHELAEERKADLLVVGSSRHALLGRVLLGDDARAALDGAPCAIAIAPRGYLQSQHVLTKVGVGYDGSPESKHALAAAHELAQQHAAQISALHVVSLQDIREEQPIPADWPATAEELVERAREDLGRLDGVEARAVYGGPREELSRFSDRVDLLIVGSRGYGPVGRLMHGSVSRYLVGHVACPLLVLPRGAGRGVDAHAGHAAGTRVGADV